MKKEPPRLTLGATAHACLPEAHKRRGTPRFARGDKKNGSGRPSYLVLPSDSESSLTSFGTASPLTSFGTASFLTSFGTASTPHPVFSSVSEKSPSCGRKRLKGRPLTSLGATEKGARGDRKDGSGGKEKGASCD
jgi:hypothetical protein